MTTDERLDAIERKLDRLLNTLGIREKASTERQHELKTLAAMPVDDLIVHMRLLKKQEGRR